MNEIPINNIYIIKGDFNAKIGRENYFGPIIGTYSLHQISNENRYKLLTFVTVTEKDLRIKSTMFLRTDLYKCIWRSPDGQFVNKIDHVLIISRFTNTVLRRKNCTRSGL